MKNLLTAALLLLTSLVTEMNADEIKLPNPLDKDPQRAMDAIRALAGPNDGHVMVLDGKPVTIPAFGRTESGAPPRQATRASVDRDAEALLVSFDCEDEDITAAITAKDKGKLWKDDSVYVWLDPAHDHKGLIMIQVSAGGVINSFKAGETDWNPAGLTADVKKTAKGWSASLRIPFAGLGVDSPPLATRHSPLDTPAAPAAVWGFNLSRMDQPGTYDYAKMEASAMLTIPGGDPGDMHRWGHLAFGRMDKPDDVATAPAHLARKRLVEERIASLADVGQSVWTFGRASKAFITVTDTNLVITGTKHVFIHEDHMEITRFSKELINIENGYEVIGMNMKSGADQAGCALVFQTDSPRVDVYLKRTHGDGREWMDTNLGVEVDGQPIKDVSFAKDRPDIALHLVAPSPGQHLYKVILPAMAFTDFYGLLLADGHKLSTPKLPATKGVYVALGDSITHGQGQGTFFHKGWSYILGRALNLDTYNRAIGGGSLPVGVDRFIGDFEHIDLITILAGYNDWMYGGVGPEKYAANYKLVIDGIRKYHPDTKIVCISPLYTRSETSQTSGSSLELNREAMKKLIRSLAEADPNLYLVEGEKISKDADLDDVVHLNAAGAKSFADEMTKEIKDLNIGY